MLHICNWRVGEDNGVGHFTFTGTNGNSVIDYALCSNNYTYLVDKFKIDERTESSHFPVCVGLKCQTSTDTFGTDVTSKGPQCKYFFNDNSTLTYRNNLTLLFNNEFVHSFALEIDNEVNFIDYIREKITSVLNEGGKCCQRTLKIFKNKQPPWFDRKCKTLKTAKHRLLRQYRRERSDSSLTAYKEGRNLFKSYCNKQRETHNKTVLEDLVANSKNRFGINWIKYVNPAKRDRMI